MPVRVSSLWSAHSNLFTACKRSLGQGNIFRSMCQEFCPWGGGGCIPACIAGGIPACLAAGLQRGSAPRVGICSWGVSGPGGSAPRGVSPGPHPRGKLRGIRSRPTPKGKIEGDQIQAHRPTSKGEVEGDLFQDPPPNSYCRGQYASYWNALLLHLVYLVCQASFHLCNWSEFTKILASKQRLPWHGLLAVFHNHWANFIQSQSLRFVMLNDFLPCTSKRSFWGNNG